MTKDFTLLIINCQNDFTQDDGALYVPTSNKAVNNICKFIEQRKDNINKIILVKNNYPSNYCIFRSFGGGYPKHCVAETPGNNIDSRLMTIIDNLNINYKIVNKGEVHDMLEGSASSYSKFIDGTFVLQTATDATRVLTDDIVVCGLLGNFDVKDTLVDLTKQLPEENIHVFIDGIASTDDGTAIQNFVEENFNVQII